MLESVAKGEIFKEKIAAWQIKKNALESKRGVISGEEFEQQSAALSRENAKIYREYSPFPERTNILSF